MKVIKPFDAARIAHREIFKWQELLIAAKRAEACNCDVILDEKRGTFYPSNPNCQAEIIDLSNDDLNKT